MRMKMNRLFSLFVLVVTLAGCQSSVKPTPTPFPTVLAVSRLPAVPAGAQGIPANVTDLLANPEFFADALVQVTGEYGRLPRLVCGYDPHPSPATWTLTTGEEVALAGGFDAPLRELFPTGLTMTVLGYWRHWQGPVGCGKQAIPQEFWYLEVTRLISPGQLARVMLTPALGEVPTVGVPPETVTPASGPLPGETEPIRPTEEPGLPTATIDFDLPLTPSPSGTPSVEEGVITGTAVASTTPPLLFTPTTLTAPTTPQTPLGTPTASPTLPPGTTATPSLTPDAVIPGASATATAPTTIVDQGEIEYYDAFLDKLDAAQSHNWVFTVEVNEPITATVIGEPTMNVGLRLLSSQNAVLIDRNNNPAGGLESIVIPVTTAGEYILQVYEAGGKGGQYFISLWDAFAMYRPMGTLQTGVPQSGTVTNLLIHTWFFWGEVGQTLMVQTSAPADSDLLLSLYGPNQNLLTSQSDMISQFDLTESGWHFLEVEEFHRDQTTYQITLTLQ